MRHKNQTLEYNNVTGEGMRLYEISGRLQEVCKVSAGWVLAGDFTTSTTKQTHNSYYRHEQKKVSIVVRHTWTQQDGNRSDIIITNWV